MNTANKCVIAIETKYGFEIPDIYFSRNVFMTKQILNKLKSLQTIPYPSWSLTGVVCFATADDNDDFVPPTSG